MYCREIAIGGVIIDTLRNAVIPIDSSWIEVSAGGVDSRFRQRVEDRRASGAVVERAVAFDDPRSVFVVRRSQQLVQLAKAIMRDRREQVMRHVHILPVNEHRPPREGIAKEDPRIRQPTSIGVRMLINVSQ